MNAKKSSPLINKDSELDDVLKYITIYAFRRGNWMKPIDPNTDPEYAAAKQQIIDLLDKQYEVGHTEGEGCANVDWMSMLAEEFNIDCGTPQEALPKLKDLINREVVAERKRLTRQKLDKKLIKADDLHVEFQFKFTPRLNDWHYGIFAADNKGKFQVVMDGKNVVKRLNQRKAK